MTEVHDLVYHGNGGFTYSDVYSMPIQYRKYHIKKINEHIERQNKEMEKAQKGNSTSLDKSQVSRPNVPQADFTTKLKAPKK